MFIIWGIRPLTKFYGTLNRPLVCNNCNNTSYYNLVAHSRWFTLYFIPVFPIEITRAIECPVCNYGYILKKSEFSEILKNKKKWIIIRYAASKI